jgi:hypothetical protein
LHFAIQFACSDVTFLLLEEGADPNFEAAGVPESPLQFARSVAKEGGDRHKRILSVLERHVRLSKSIGSSRLHPWVVI